MLPLWIRVDLGVMEDSYTFSQSPKLELHHQIQFYVILSTSIWGGGLPISGGYSQHILIPTNKGKTTPWKYYGTSCIANVAKNRIIYIANIIINILILYFILFSDFGTNEKREALPSHKMDQLKHCETHIDNQKVSSQLLKNS